MWHVALYRILVFLVCICIQPGIDNLPISPRTGADFCSKNFPQHFCPPAGKKTSDLFKPTPLTRAAYTKIINLRFGEAQAAIRQLKQAEPDNLITPLLENYLDFFTVFANDNRAEFKRLAKNMAPRLTQIARGNRKSPWFLYAQAEIRLQWAILQSRFGHHLAAFREIKQAYALLEQNQREHPDFMANKKSLGILHALVGNVPEEYHWGLKILSGMQGSVVQGLGELDMVLEYGKQHEFLFTTEVHVAYAFLQLHLSNNKTAAWEALSAGKLNVRESPLAAFALASLAMRTGRNDLAIATLEACPSGAGYHPFYYRDYLLGIAKLNRLDKDAAIPLLRFTQDFKGETGLKEAYQKCAWQALILENKTGYERYMKLVKKVGNDRSEPDKAALREANSGETPDVRLTKARLLFDGGYYQRAYDLLQVAEARYAGNTKSALEYQYRLGRIADELGNSAEAIRLYSQTVQTGANEPWYFACNAALHLGLLYEKKGNKSAARSAFKRCLKIKPESYATSLHAKAKAGLNRL